MPSQDFRLIVFIYLFFLNHCVFTLLCSGDHTPSASLWWVGLQKFQQFLNIEGKIMEPEQKSSTFRLKILCCCWCGFRGSPRWDGGAQGNGNLKFGGLGGFLLQDSAQHELSQY